MKTKVTMFMSSD